MMPISVSWDSASALMKYCNVLSVCAQRVGKKFKKGGDADMFAGARKQIRGVNPIRCPPALPPAVYQRFPACSAHLRRSLHRRRRRWRPAPRPHRPVPRPYPACRGWPGWIPDQGQPFFRGADADARLKRRPGIGRWAASYWWRDTSENGTRHNIQQPTRAAAGGGSSSTRPPRRTANQQLVPTTRGRRLLRAPASSFSKVAAEAHVLRRRVTACSMHGIGHRRLSGLGGK